jgi:uncharacterized repeat protein (TIGR03803 family)
MGDGGSDAGLGRETAVGSVCAIDQGKARLTLAASNPPSLPNRKLRTKLSTKLFRERAMPSPCRIVYGLALAALVLRPFSGTAATFQTLHQFGQPGDGSQPEGRPVFDENGILYGTTFGGGAAGGGTIYRFDPASGQETLLYSFSSGGLTGSSPAAGLIYRNGVLYGTTQEGGQGNFTKCDYGCGTVFKLSLSTGVLTTLHAFTYGADGALPAARLAFDSAGNLYGTANFAGSTASCNVGCGTVFKIDPVSGVFTTLHQFAAPGLVGDGSYPVSALVFDSAGVLYGTTSSGGTYDNGTAFKLDPVSGAYSVLHAFDAHVDGADIQCDLAFDGGYLVGTAYSGGTSKTLNDGTVFAMSPTTGAVATLHQFTGAADGSNPQPGVTVGNTGLLFGTANGGGGARGGTAFALNPVSGQFTLLHVFNTATGSGPYGGLTLYNGALYGITLANTLYRITP